MTLIKLTDDTKIILKFGLKFMSFQYGTVCLIFVVSAGTTNTLKNRLDKFWSDQDILYTKQISMASGTVV